MQGIYAIRCIVNYKVRVGQAVNIENRFKEHQAKLKAGYHVKSLQEDYDKYGANCFEFIVLEEINDYDLLTERERYWMDDVFNARNPKYGYNLKKAIDSARESNKKTWSNLELRKKMSEKAKEVQNRPEVKAKVIASNKANWDTARRERYSKMFSGENNPMYNKQMSEESKSKISKTLKDTGVFKGSNNPIAVLDDDKVRQIVVMLKDKISMQKIADDFNVKISTIKNIKYGSTWTHITGGRL